MIESNKKVTFETAKLTAKVNFNLVTDTVYQYSDKDIPFCEEVKFPKYYARGCNICSRPTQEQVINWLREARNIFIEIQIDRTTDPKFCYEIFKYTDFGNWELISKRPEMFLTLDWHKNIEDALQEALNYLIQPM